MFVSIMTYNVCHFSDYRLKDNAVSMGGYAEVINAQNADIVGLNEVYSKYFGKGHENQPEVIARLTNNSHHYFAGAIKVKGLYPYGNALISKHAFDGETVMIPDPDKSQLNGEHGETRCVLRADFVLDGKRLTVLDSHFGLNLAEQKNAVSTVCKLVDKIDNPTVLMGDFNLEPTSPLLTPLFERFNDTQALLDGGSHFTFPSDKPIKKIDYLLYKGGIRAASAKIVTDVISDHLALCGVFEL